MAILEFLVGLVTVELLRPAVKAFMRPFISPLKEQTEKAAGEAGQAVVDGLQGQGPLVAAARDWGIGFPRGAISSGQDASPEGSSEQGPSAKEKSQEAGYGRAVVSTLQWPLTWATDGVCYTTGYCWGAVGKVGEATPEDSSEQGRDNEAPPETEQSHEAGYGQVVKATLQWPLTLAADGVCYTTGYCWGVGPSRGAIGKDGEALPKVAEQGRDRDDNHVD